MIKHVLLYRFPDYVTPDDRDEFFNAMMKLLTAMPTIVGASRNEHIRLPIDDDANPSMCQDVVQFWCSSVSGLREFSEANEVHDFVKEWRSRLAFEATYVNYDDDPDAPPIHRVVNRTHDEHAETVEAPIGDVWDVLLDVEGYPRIFAPTQSVKILEKQGDRELVELVVEVPSGEIMKWTSRRDIDAERRVVRFQQEQRAPLVEHMSGEWRAFPLSEVKTQIVLTHTFGARVPRGSGLTLSQAQERLACAAAHAMAVSTSLRSALRPKEGSDSARRGHRPTDHGRLHGG